MTRLDVARQRRDAALRTQLGSRDGVLWWAVELAAKDVDGTGRRPATDAELAAVVRGLIADEAAHEAETLARLEATGVRF